MPYLVEHEFHVHLLSRDFQEEVLAMDGEDVPFVLEEPVHECRDAPCGSLVEEVLHAQVQFLLEGYEGEGGEGDWSVMFFTYRSDPLLAVFLSDCERRIFFQDLEEVLHLP